MCKSMRKLLSAYKVEKHTPARTCIRTHAHKRTLLHAQHRCRKLSNHVYEAAVEVVLLPGKMLSTYLPYLSLPPACHASCSYKTHTYIYVYISEVFYLKYKHMLDWNWAASKSVRHSNKMQKHVRTIYIFLGVSLSSTI